jgi:hypothetical protein
VGKTKYSKQWTPDQAVRETKVLDDSLPEASTSDHLSRFSDRAGGVDHQAGEDEGQEEPADASALQGLPVPPDPPRRPPQPERE